MCVSVSSFQDLTFGSIVLAKHFLFLPNILHRRYIYLDEALKPFMKHFKHRGTLNCTGTHFSMGGVLIQ